ncbi:MAG: aminotransferase class I/II-fold pyridoxal phosphate-dependent enzyme [Campylobacterota bacterium]
MYEKALQALQKSGRFRHRDVFNTIYTDLASNDYLGLASKKKTLRQTCELLETLPYHSPKASQLVNGYHPIHQEFERTLCFKNGFEDGMIVGSGFLANMAMIEALGRKECEFIIDEHYHASGIVATKLVQSTVTFFKHNCMQDLRDKVKKAKKKVIIVVEGIYSMDGDIVDKEVFAIAEAKEALLIVDEAHSSGVLGDNLLGVFDYYKIDIQSNHIKMGTLGKAYGSYGAYILASKVIISYLENRAKSIIYTTAPSLFDTALGYFNFKYIQKKHLKLAKKIQKRINACNSPSLIVKYEMPSNEVLLDVANKIKDSGYIVGAIRKPTVDKPMIRLIARTDVKIQQIQEVIKIIDDKKNI